MANSQNKKISFFKKDWVIPVTIIVSIFGGGPGLISIIQFFTNKPGFEFHPKNVAKGTFYNQFNLPMNYLLVTGAIYNPGERPLFPFDFALEATYKGRVVYLKPLALVDTIAQKAIYKNHVSFIKEPFELLKTARVNAHDIVYGTLCFVTSYGGYEKVDADKIVLKCMGIDKKLYSVTFPDPSGIGLTYDPKTGTGL
jgi:hypothetical protein